MQHDSVAFHNSQTTKTKGFAFHVHYLHGNVLGEKHNEQMYLGLHTHLCPQGGTA